MWLAHMGKPSRGRNCEHTLGPFRARSLPFRPLLPLRAADAEALHRDCYQLAVRELGVAHPLALLARSNLTEALMRLSAASPAAGQEGAAEQQPAAAAEGGGKDSAEDKAARNEARVLLKVRERCSASGRGICGCGFRSGGFLGHSHPRLGLGFSTAQHVLRKPAQTTPYLPIPTDFTERCVATQVVILTRDKPGTPRATIRPDPVMHLYASILRTLGALNNGYPARLVPWFPPAGRSRAHLQAVVEAWA